MRWGSVRVHLTAVLTLACSGESADGAGVYDDADPGCDVLVCPAGVERCCTEVLATATDNELGDYERRTDLLQGFEQSAAEVRANFAFNVADQRGAIVFNLGRQRRLDSLSVLLTTNVSPGSIVVTLSDTTRSGCVATIGSDVVSAGPLEYDVFLQEDDFCFLGGMPGAGSVLEFAILADGPGAVSLAIQRVELN